MEFGMTKHSAGARTSTEPSKGLTRQYVVALLLVAVLASTAFTLLTTLLSAQSSDAPQINVSGRQRMLSQRINVMALRMVVAETDEERQTARETLGSAVELMESSHLALTQGSEEMGISAELAENLQEHYFGDVGLDEQVKSYLAAARHLLDTGSIDSEEARADLAFLIARAHKPLLADLNKAVGLYEGNSSARTALLHKVETGIWLSTLLLLLLEGIFIFRPMVSRIRSQVAELEERNDALSFKDRRIKLLLDSTRDGLLPVGLDGRVQEGASSQVGQWFGECGPDSAFWDILCSDDDTAMNMELGFEQLVDDILPFELVLEQAVSSFVRGEMTYGVDYREILEGGERTGFLLVIRDITEEVAREAAEAEAREFASALGHILRDQGGFLRLVNETRSMLTAAADNETSQTVRDRLLHTVKGNTAIFGFSGFAAMVHEAEDALLEGQSAEPIIAELAVAWEERVERLKSVLTSNDGLWISTTEHVQHLEQLRNGTPTNHLVPLVERWKFESARSRLEKLGGAATRIAERLGKSIRVEVDVETGVRLSAEQFGPLWSAMVHVVRNAVDHGFESPDARGEAGKSEEGVLTLGCAMGEGVVAFTVADDGGGINWEAVRNKAARVGLPAQTREDLIEALFADGVSSRDDVSDLSGRGVGMAAFREAVVERSGKVWVSSEPGTGTRFTAAVPLPQIPAYADLMASDGEPLGAEPPSIVHLALSQSRGEDSALLA